MYANVPQVTVRHSSQGSPQHMATDAARAQTESFWDDFYKAMDTAAIQANPPWELHLIPEVGSLQAGAFSGSFLRETPALNPRFQDATLSWVHWHTSLVPPLERQKQTGF